MLAYLTSTEWKQYILQITSATSTLQHTTLHELWHSTKFAVNQLYTFSCKAFVLLPNNQYYKLSNHSVNCIYLGPCHHSSTHKFYNPKTKHTILSRNVLFNELSTSSGYLPQESINFTPLEEEEILQVQLLQ